MDFNEFRDFGNSAIELVIRYLRDIRKRDVLPSVEPFSIIHALPDEMPEQAENWQSVLNDVENILMPALTHWQSPHFHAFYPSGSSMGSIVGELLIAGLGVLGLNWDCSPACVELEVVVLDWLAKFLRLPLHFQHSAEGPGGGVIQSSASEAILVAVISAREQMVRRMAKHLEMSESMIRRKLIAYSSDQSNSCIEKACKLACLPIKLLTTSDDYVLCAQELEAAIKEDLSRGLIPTMCIATLGTTGTCAYDDIKALAKICQRYQIWLHVDAAYAGAALALDEYAQLHDGLLDIDSLNINLHKLLMVNYDGAVMWLKDARKLVETLQVNRIYLENNEKTNKHDLPDFRNWQISLGRRFRALKVWIAFRTVGAEGLRSNLRKHMKLSTRFEKYILADNRFELVAKCTLGIVCFRVRGENKLTTRLLQRLLDRKRIYMVQSIHGAKIFLRFVICGMDTKDRDVDFAWTEIQNELSEMRVTQETFKIPDGIAKCESAINAICLEALGKRKSLNLGDMYLCNSSEKYK
ncbi:3,4-dihydroxyphenylacetaldehyde synthase 2 isoform X1 [Bactrocera oleae]|uniref:3,4-dihydroxyphenylacetaldehyde synthase 2 isoform X1 n=1 Tax=Bactrocera oleae TaxID=104688 RepID=UPI0006B7F3DC